MGKVSRRSAVPHHLWFEHLEERSYLSTAPSGASGSSPPMRYRLPALLAQLGSDSAPPTTDNVQSYFNLVKRLSDATPQVTMDAQTGDWNLAHTALDLSAYATYAGTGGDSALSYTWSATSAPPGALPQFSANNSFAAHDTTVTFDRAGDYTFSVLISDGVYSVTDSVSFTVSSIANYVAINAGNTQLGASGTHQFFASLYDQFNRPMNAPVTWGSQGVGTLTSGGFYTAPRSSGTATIQASAGSMTASVNVTVVNAAPTVATPAAVSGQTSTTANLSVLGADDGGEPALSYTWSLANKPDGSNPLFSVNGKNAAKNTTVTFDKAGTYTFTVTIFDGSASTSSAVLVTVSQALTAIQVAPPAASVNLNQSASFTATGFDQFGNILAVQPAFTWSKLSGVGAINSSGAFASGTAGTATIKAAASGVSGTASVTVNNAPPTLASPAAVTGQTSTTVSLSALGADDGGESGLTYAWSLSSGPTGAAPSFSVNGNNAAKNTTVTLNKTGTYTFAVVISDGSFTVGSSVTLTVSQILSSIQVSPPGASVNLNQNAGFSAAAFDQFGMAMAVQPTFTWSKVSGVGAIGTGGVFSSATAGNAVIKAAVGGIGGTSSIAVNNAAPTIAIAAASSGQTSTSVNLSTLGADDGGESGLTYTWSLTSGPTGATPGFSANGTNASKNTTVTFNKAGTYAFTVVISDGSASASSSVMVTVSQVLTSIQVSPGNTSVNLNQNANFSATGFDQFGAALVVQPAFTWSIASGVGSINSSGAFSSGGSGSALIKATASGVSGNASVTVNNAAPTISSPASASGQTSTAVNLSVLGADDGGEAGLVYSWAMISGPTGATPGFSANGTNASKNTTVTFNLAGGYTFRVTVSDGTNSTTSQVNVTVSQVVTGISVTPGSAPLAANSTQQFSASATDQFGQAMSAAFTWSVDSGGDGSINSAGLFTSGSAAGSATIRASSGGISSTASSTISAPTGNTVAVTTRPESNFTELVITGTSGNDTIFVSQSGTTFTIVGDGVTQTITGTFGDMVIHAGSGGSNITVDSSVTINTLVYGGAGNDTIANRANAIYTAVITIGGGVDTVSGNGVKTDMWVDSSDIANASSAEIAGGHLHVVSQFYQPWTTDPSNPDYVPLQLNGQNLRDPSDTGTPEELPNRSLFGTDISFADLGQGQIADCYLLSAIQAIGFADPDRLRSLAVDLGDGTYAVEIDPTGTPQFVRVDGDFAAFQAQPGSSGDIWGMVFEKALAFSLQQQNTYASLNFGFPAWVFYEFGMIYNPISTSTDGATFVTEIQNAISAHEALTVATSNTIAQNAPLITAHAYAVVGAYISGGVAYIQLHNPWGFDGAGNDSNPNDGIVTLTFTQFQANFSSVLYAIC